jgi:hypothetical protein
MPAATNHDNTSAPQDFNEEKFDRTYDFKSVVSIAGSLAFLCGWVYNIGFFSALNYDFMDFLTINDYALSTLTALPAILLFFIPASFAIGFLFGARSRRSKQAGKETEPVRDYIFGFMAFGVAPYATISVILNYYRGYWESLAFAFIGMFGATLVVLLSATIFRRGQDDRVLLYGLVASTSILLLAAIAAGGAGEARTYLKGDLNTQVHIKGGVSGSPFLVRSISNGVVVLYPDLPQIGFIPNTEIQYFSSAKKNNRMFDLNNIVRSMQP